MKRTFIVHAFVAMVLFIAATISIAQTSQQDEQTHSAITPVDREQEWWQARYKAMNARIAVWQRRSFPVDQIRRYAKAVSRANGLEPSTFSLEG